MSDEFYQITSEFYDVLLSGAKALNYKKCGSLVSVDTENPDVDDTIELYAFWKKDKGVLRLFRNVDENIPVCAYSFETGLLAGAKYEAWPRYFGVTIENLAALRGNLPDYIPNNIISRSFVPAEITDTGYFDEGVIKTDLIYLGQFSETDIYRTWILFKNVSIPRFQTLYKAEIEFTSERYYSAYAKVIVSGIPGNTSAPPTTEAEFDALVKTSATVTHQFAEWGEEGETHTIEVTEIIQEAVSSFDWNSGDNLMVCVIPDPAATNGKYRGAKSVSEGLPPKLITEWTTE